MLVACCDQKRGHLDVALLEDHLALLVADDGRPYFPLDLVERIDPFLAEEPDKVQTGRGCGCRWAWCGRLSSGGFHLRSSASVHISPPKTPSPSTAPNSRLAPKTYKLSLEARTRRVGSQQSAQDKVRQACSRPSPRSKSHVYYPVLPTLRGLGCLADLVASPSARWMSVGAKAGTIMAPVYVVVKARSTTYCALFLDTGARYGQSAKDAGFF